ncbi:MAG: hypothetical protein BMS9Abin37_2185 [Acidobacteriota bacterium]|nr:MAG: hypothetical protein BMS9Abin37_2185 [Acidobacteriota bacterium]
MLQIAILLAVLAPQAEGRLPIGGNLSARYQHVFNRNSGLFENQDSSWGEVRRSEKPRLPITQS